MFGFNTEIWGLRDEVKRLKQQLEDAKKIIQLLIDNPGHPATIEAARIDLKNL